MAGRPKGFGLTRELENKKRSSYDSELAKKVCDWFNAVCKQSAESQYMADFGGDYDWNNTHEKLKDGKLLIAVANRIVPDKKKKIQTLNSPFKLMENIGNFLAIASGIGVNDTDLFQTASLYEGGCTRIFCDKKHLTKNPTRRLLKIKKLRYLEKVVQQLSHSKSLSDEDTSAKGLNVFNL